MLVTLILVAAKLEAIAIVYALLLLHMHKCAQLIVYISNGGHRNFVVRAHGIFITCYIDHSFSNNFKSIFRT